MKAFNPVVAALPFVLASASFAKEPPRAARIYLTCVLKNFRHPGEERSDNFEEAQQLAAAQCGNLRPAAIEMLQRKATRNMTQGGDDPELAAQALLDIMVLEQSAAIWAEWHPQEIYHGR